MSATEIAQQQQPAPRRRRPRRKAPPFPGQDYDTTTGTAVRANAYRGFQPLSATASSARLWTLMQEAQAEMERGTDALGDELTVLWRNFRDVPEGGAVANDDNDNDDDDDDDDGDRDGGRRSGGVVGDGPARYRVTATEEAPRPRPRRRGNGRRNKRLPPEDADALLEGLVRLKAEMEAEARSFQQRMGALSGRLESLAEAEPGGVGGREEVELEEEAESMRAAVVASHARLLGRVREVRTRMRLVSCAVPSMYIFFGTATVHCIIRQTWEDNKKKRCIYIASNTYLSSCCTLSLEPSMLRVLNTVLRGSVCL